MVTFPKEKLMCFPNLSLQLSISAYEMGVPKLYNFMCCLKSQSNFTKAHRYLQTVPSANFDPRAIKSTAKALDGQVFEQPGTQSILIYFYPFITLLHRHYGANGHCGTIRGRWPLAGIKMPKALWATDQYGTFIECGCTNAYGIWE